MFDIILAGCKPLNLYGFLENIIKILGIHKMKENKCNFIDNELLFIYKLGINLKILENLFFSRKILLNKHN